MAKFWPMVGAQSTHGMALIKAGIFLYMSWTLWGSCGDYRQLTNWFYVHFFPMHFKRGKELKLPVGLYFQRLQPGLLRGVIIWITPNTCRASNVFPLMNPTQLNTGSSKQADHTVFGSFHRQGGGNQGSRSDLLQITSTQNRAWSQTQACWLPILYSWDCWGDKDPGIPWPLTEVCRRK